MATFSTIDAKKAPAPARPPVLLQDRMLEYDGFVRRLKNGQVGKLTPTGNETTRALMLRLGGASRRLKKRVDVWAVDGVVYFKLG